MSALLRSVRRIFYHGTGNPNHVKLERLGGGYAGNGEYFIKEQKRVIDFVYWRAWGCVWFW